MMTRFFCRAIADDEKRFGDTVTEGRPANPALIEAFEPYVPLIQQGRGEEGLHIVG